MHEAFMVASSQPIDWTQLGAGGVIGVVLLAAFRELLKFLRIRGLGDRTTSTMSNLKSAELAGMKTADWWQLEFRKIIVEVLSQIITPIMERQEHQLEKQTEILGVVAATQRVVAMALKHYAELRQYDAAREK